MSCGRVHAQNSAADALDEMEYKWAAFINMLFKDVFTAGNSGRRLFFCTCFLWLHFFSPLFFFFFLFFSAAFCPGAFLAPGIFAICDSPSNSGSGSVWIRSRYDEFQQQHPVTPDECQKVSENIRWNSSDYSCSVIHSLIRQWPTCSACSRTHRVSVIVKSIVFQRSEARRLEMYPQNNDLPNRVTSVWDCVSTFPRVEPLCIFEQVTTTFQHLNCLHRRIF